MIAVDEDIDPENADALFWAMSYRCNPHIDDAHACLIAIPATGRAPAKAARISRC